MALLAVLLFVFTTLVARAFHAHRHLLGEQWFQRGRADLQHGRPADAVSDFRNALVYDRENAQYSLRLAESLAAVGRTAEAEAYLLNLWERTPGDGTINLHLARLAAKDGRIDAAHRYFHNAVYGVWDGDAEQQRRRVRWEMIDFLVLAGRNSEAAAELASFAGDLPENDAGARVRFAGLYARTGRHQEAFDAYRAALQIDGDNAGALAGAGNSAFVLGRFSVAERFLARARRRDPKNEEVASRLDIARAAQSLDPFAYRLSASTRAQRAARAFDLTLERLQSCAAAKGQPLDDPASDSALAVQYRAGTAMKPRPTSARLRRDEEALDAVMEYVFRSQQLAAQECGPGAAHDQALVLLSARPENE